MWLTKCYPEAQFGGFSDIDGTVAFYARVNSLVTQSSRIVDFGCGRGSHSADPVSFRRELRSLRGKASRVIGLDVDRDAEGNPFVDEFRLLSDGRPWPLDCDSIDLIVGDFVVEHLLSPSGFFDEVVRVLVPGGYLCIRTPNAIGYVALAARLIPNRCHGGVLSAVQPKRDQKDIFPTYYNCNTLRSLRNELRLRGLRECVYGYEAEPSYLGFSKAAYALGVLHQKVAPGFLRPTIFAFAQKAAVSRKTPTPGI